MNPALNQRHGRFEVSVFRGETVRAFVPPPLPPIPSAKIDHLQLLLEQANQAASFPTAAGAIEHMQRIGIVDEITGRQRSRLFVYRRYLRILSEGTEPLTP